MNDRINLITQDLLAIDKLIYLVLQANAHPWILLGGIWMLLQ